MARTDNDSWDVATGVAATATLVAAARAVATRSRGSDPLRTRVWCATPPGSGRHRHQRVRQPQPVTRRLGLQHDLAEHPAVGQGL